MVIKERYFFTEANKEANKVRDSLAIFSEELSLARKWNRPSILIATFRSEYVRQYAEAVLEDLLLARDDSVVRFVVEKGQFDIPAELRKSPRRREEVFFVSGLRHGGGKSGRNAYRALNLRREFLVDEKIRAVFWLTDAEAHGLPRFAPDFWAFRHRVIELDDFYFQSFRNRSKMADNLLWHDNVARYADVEKFKALLNNAEQVVEKTKRTQSGSINIKQLYLFAYVLWKAGNYQQALSLLSRGVQIAAQSNSTLLESKLLSAVGIVHFQLNNYDEAIVVLKRACTQSPGDYIIWNNLGLPLYFGGYVDDAISAIRRAIDLNPKNAGSWHALGDVYFDLGHLDEARLAYKRCVKYDSLDPVAWYSLGTVYTELVNKKLAFHAFRKANKIDASFEIPDH
jgi:tetratricopeptide (TPR) repeat protein